MTHWPALTADDLRDLPAGWHRCPICKGTGRGVRYAYTLIDLACHACTGERVLAERQYRAWRDALVRINPISPAWQSPDRRQA